MRFQFVIQTFVFLIAINLFSASVALSDKGDQYVLGKIGSMAVDKNDADGILAVGAIYGVGITPSLTIEFEGNVTADGGDFQSSTESGSYDIWTVASYLVFRHVFDAATYFKLKGGVVHEDVELSKTITATSENKTTRESGIGIAGGLGIGFVLASKEKPVMIELEITATDEDIIFYSFGMTYPF